MHAKRLIPKAKPDSLNSFDDAQQSCLADTGTCTKEENPMYMNAYMNTDNYTRANNTNKVYDGTLDQERDYLRQRLDLTADNKRIDLERQFGLLDDERPNTPEELIQRIKDGKYIIRKDTDGSFFNHIVFGRFQWRDPSVKEDQAGFDAAWKEYQATLQPVRDAVEILSPVEALEKLTALN